MTTDTAALKQLWHQAFGDSREFIDGFFRTGFDPMHFRCIGANGEPAAALYWFDCRWGHRRLAYIYGVATKRQLQGQGLCRRLMEQTHQQLVNQGYSGAVLVPGEPGLFAMYEKMGYSPFGPMERTTVLSGGELVPVEPVTAARYGSLRLPLLPEGGIDQSGPILEFLGTYARFYAFDGGIFSAAREGETLYLQEFLGDAGKLPGILRSLNIPRAQVRLPGKGTPFAMYRSFTQEDRLPGYLGIALD